MTRFYAEYIPLYRDAVAGAMDCCRAQLLPVKRQHKKVMEKLYALTQSAVGKDAIKQLQVQGIISYVRSREQEEN